MSRRGVATAAAAGIVLALASHPHHGHGLTAILDSIQAAPVAAGSSYTPQSWARAVLRDGHWPRTPADITSLEAWTTHECPWNAQPPDGCAYTHNPLNLTYGAGATGSVPGTPNVSILPDWGTGIADTAARIASGLFGDVAAALASGTGLCGRSLTGLHSWSAGPQAPADQGYWRVC